MVEAQCPLEVPIDVYLGHCHHSQLSGQILVLPMMLILQPYLDLLGVVVQLDIIGYVALYLLSTVAHANGSSPLTWHIHTDTNSLLP